MLGGGLCSSKYIVITMPRNRHISDISIILVILVVANVRDNPQMGAALERRGPYLSAFIALLSSVLIGYNAQSTMLRNGFEVSVIVEQGYVMLDSDRCNHAVHGIPNRDTSSSQLAIYVG